MNVTAAAGQAGNASCAGSINGSCAGGPFGSLTLVAAPDQPAADIICQSLVGQDAQTVTNQTAGYTAMPSNIWQCLG